VEKDIYVMTAHGCGKLDTRFHMVFTDFKFLCSKDTSDFSQSSADLRLICALWLQSFLKVKTQPNMKSGKLECS